MPTADLVLKNCRLVQKERIIAADMVIDEGKITEISRDTANITADNTIDAAERLVIPGCIDIHTHSREPRDPNSPPNQEDFTTETRAAAAGGYTTIFDMPVTGSPPTTTVNGFRIKKRLAEQRCLVDYALYGGAGFANIPEIKPLAEAGAVAFKIFTREIEPEDERWKGVTIGGGGAEIFSKVMKEVAKTGRILSIHCEDDRLIRFLTDRSKSAGEVRPTAHYRSTPNASEFLEVAQSIRLAQTTGATINIAHLSTAEATSMVKNAKREGLPVYAEVSPHHLLLTDRDMVEKLGPYGKMYPPLRTERDREALWRAVSEGVIDFLANDHAPHPREAKEPGWENIFEAASGVPGLETALPLMLTQVNRGRLDVFRLVDLMSRKPAGAFGLDGVKGGLEVGLDADFVVVDLKREGVLREEDMYTRSSAKIFDGWRVTGLPVVTAVRGVVVMEEGEVLGRPGYGEFVSAEGRSKS